MPQSVSPAFLKRLSNVFSLRVQNYGDTPAGVLWKDIYGQQLRFEVLVNILNDVPASNSITLSDIGCGYGAFFDFLSAQPKIPQFTYAGYDISTDMVNRTLARIKGSRGTCIVSDRSLRPVDYTFVSGTYNLRLDIDDNDWNSYVKTSLSQLWEMTDQGLAFNMLDKNHRNRLDGLYYADSNDFMDYCSRLSPNITLINDYPLDEWTLFIRR